MGRSILSTFGFGEAKKTGEVRLEGSKEDVCYEDPTKIKGWCPKYSISHLQGPKLTRTLSKMNLRRRNLAGVAFGVRVRIKDPKRSFNRDLLLMLENLSRM